MKKKLLKENKQLSLQLDSPAQAYQMESSVVDLVLRTASIIPFPHRQPQDFRERIIQELIRTRVVVTNR